jgi:acyl carrier protein
MKSIEQAEAEIRAVLRDHGRLAQDVAALTRDADLYQAGMTSHASVNVMLALEGKFDVEFPDRMLKRSVFASIDAIRSALTELGAAAEAADAQVAQT